MKKTLILCFIHGFQGGESTFGDDYRFAEHLRDLVAAELPKINIKTLVYPKYETRGDLGETVSRFRSWLEDKVIDLEVATGTPSPTIDPSVRTILIGHSMGGIVAAEMVIAIASEQPIYSEDGIQKSATLPSSFNSLLFPYIQGVLAFDTPYLGIAPGVVAHGAEGHYQNAASAITQLSGLGASLWGANKAATSTRAAPPSAGALPPATGTGNKSAGGWGTWGKVAMVAGAAGAVAAGGAAAWMNRDHIGEGWTWVSSHLEFVGCLARAEELKKRVSYMVRLNEELSVGFANLYTRLGRAASSKNVSMVGTVLGSERTFCNLPRSQAAGVWKEAVNDKATDETVAHMTMFEPKENPDYETLSETAKTLIAEWVSKEWYETSEEPMPLLEQAPSP
ncbi:unnamed protein product [Clonostachys solani]|uniref:DUF676 domain-containing protein n=1 Tax=Clonostachys solani TaxID=160281 RepID=A0A9N9Z534_9HYPO|nr:unnamed protein product [Clonostachys solani]